MVVIPDPPTLKIGQLDHSIIDLVQELAEHWVIGAKCASCGWHSLPPRFVCVWGWHHRSSCQLPIAIFIYPQLRQLNHRLRQFSFSGTSQYGSRYQPCLQMTLSVHGACHRLVSIDIGRMEQDHHGRRQSESASRVRRVSCRSTRSGSPGDASFHPSQGEDNEFRQGVKPQSDRAFANVIGSLKRGQNHEGQKFRQNPGDADILPFQLEFLPPKVWRPGGQERILHPYGENKSNQFKESADTLGKSLEELVKVSLMSDGASTKGDRTSNPRKTRSANIIHGRVA